MALHEDQPVLRGGPPLSKARGALLLLHGRGATAEDIFALGDEMARSEPELAYAAPKAEGNQWYPHRFLAPVTQNEPYLSSALGVVGSLVAEASQNRIPLGRIILAGFSQGACLCLEFACRHARRYGGVVGFSGALIGARGDSRALTGTFDGMPVYLGCDVRDPHIPLECVEESAHTFQALGASVTKSLFRGLGHGVNDEEIAAFKAIVRRAVSG